MFIFNICFKISFKGFRSDGLTTPGRNSIGSKSSLIAFEIGASVTFPVPFLLGKTIKIRLLLR